MYRGYAVVLLIVGLCVSGCSRQIPVSPTEEYGGSYQLVSGTAGGGQLNLLDLPNGVPKVVIFTAPAETYGTVVFVYNPALVSPFIADSEGEKEGSENGMLVRKINSVKRRYERTVAGTRAQRAREGGGFLGAFRQYGQFRVWWQGPRHPITGENHNALGGWGNTARDSEDNHVDRSATFLAKNKGAGNWHNGPFPFLGQAVNDEFGNNLNDRAAMRFQAPFPREDKRTFRMTLEIPDDAGYRWMEYTRDMSTFQSDEKPAETVAGVDHEAISRVTTGSVTRTPMDVETYEGLVANPPYEGYANKDNSAFSFQFEMTDSLSGTWVLDAGHRNGIWFDHTNPNIAELMGIPTSIRMRWEPRPGANGLFQRNRLILGTDGVKDLNDYGIVLQRGFIWMDFDKPAHIHILGAGQERVFNSRSTYNIVNGVPQLLGAGTGGISSLRGMSADDSEATFLSPGSVDFNLVEGKMLTVKLTQGGKTYTLEYERAPQRPQEVEGFGDRTNSVLPIPTQLF